MSSIISVCFSFRIGSEEYFNAMFINKRDDIYLFCFCMVVGIMGVKELLKNQKKKIQALVAKTKASGTVLPDNVELLNQQVLTKDKALKGVLEKGLSAKGKRTGRTRVAPPDLPKRVKKKKV